MENRVIKFRAWDMLRKEFLPTDCYAVLPSCDFGATAVMIKDFDNYRAGEYFYDKSQVLMQFTGLLDKNGKEIYEGDIIGYVTASGFSTTKENGRVENVEFSGGGFSPFAIPGWEVNPAPEEIEVIGNIFENPELLPPRH